MPRHERAHFYLARVADAARFTAFLAEHYADEEEDDEDERPISEFYGSQGEVFCDHDFMETGRRPPGATLEAFFAPHSYAAHWSAAVCEAARAAGLEDADALIFISCDQVASPRSVRGAGFELVYVGAFEYPI